jgi:hypothetical protein
VPLDLNELYRDVQEMIDHTSGESTAEQMAKAQRYLQHADPRQLREKLDEREQGAAKIPWLVAQPTDSLAGVFSAQTPPADYCVAAADGSTIPPDRHTFLRFYVLNVGYAILTYGRTPGAKLDANAQLCYQDADLYFETRGGARIPIDGTRLGLWMEVSELEMLRQATHSISHPAVALSDGSLILWNLQNEDPELKDAYLGQFLAALESFRTDRIPVASYISFPGSNEVGNSLRLMLCDNASQGCTRCQPNNDARQLCQFISTVLDRQLFEDLLKPGDRTDVFQSQSAILRHYGPHTIQFYYLNVGGEIARIEAPQWVMQEPAMRDLVQSTVFDQCGRSGQYPPYPPVLIEAHEQAVISTADRRAVTEMIERVLAARGQDQLRSAKDRSKRSRGV